MIFYLLHVQTDTACRNFELFRNENGQN